MFVLSRRESEVIKIGDNVFVKIVQTGKGSIKIGIDAPKHVRVVRGELLQDCQRRPVGQTLRERLDARRRKSKRVTPAVDVAPTSAEVA